MANNSKGQTAMIDQPLRQFPPMLELAGSARAAAKRGGEDASIVRRAHELSRPPDEGGLPSAIVEVVPCVLEIWFCTPSLVTS